jgi:hypothetical protein
MASNGPIWKQVQRPFNDTRRGLSLSRLMIARPCLLFALVGLCCVTSPIVIADDATRAVTYLRFVRR